jgi:adenylyl-sulfate kinase
MSNLTPPSGFVSRREREERHGDRALTLWFTGLSGSGKSTLARALERQLFDGGRQVFVLDGDTVRTALCGDLGFSAADRAENIRRVAHAARLFNLAGVTVLCSLISPTRESRGSARDVVGAESFRLVHVATPVEACRARDPKGLYAKADAGEIANFTGVSAPYEAPEDPDLALDTSQLSLEQCLEALAKLL